MGETVPDDVAHGLRMAAAADELALVKMSVTVVGHATSVALEPVFWRELQRIAATRGVSLSALISEVDDIASRRSATLAATLRLFVLRDLDRR